MRNTSVVIFCLWALGSWVANTVLSTRYITKNIVYWGATEVEPGQCFSVYCMISVFDPYRWTRNGIPLDHRTSGVRLKEEKTSYNQWKLSVEVDNAGPHQVGEFRCVTFNRQYHHTRMKGTTSRRPEPNGMMLSSGEALYLECPVDSENDTVRWYKNSREVEQSVRILLEKSSLYIPEATFSDIGEYVCWVGDPGNGHILEVYGAHVEPCYSFNETEVAQGESLTLCCQIYGHPQPKVTWFVGNVVLSHLRQRLDLIAQYPLGDQQPWIAELHLSDAEATDEALYTCHASNEYASHETSIYVRVKEVHIVTNLEESDRHLVVKLGTPISLQCNSTHPEGILLEWRKNDILVRNDNGAEILLFEANNSLLIPFARRSDLGEYLCVIQTPVSIHSARIFVQEQMLSLLGSPENNRDDLVVLRPGNNLTLHCNSSQDWKLLWYKDGELLVMNERVQVQGMTLIVINATEQDAGHYMCVVRADDQVQRLINASVNVGVAPEVMPFPVSDAAKESFRWELICQVIAGVPEPVLLWFKDGILLEETETDQDEEGPKSRIRIRSGVRSSILEWEYLIASDRGFYTCLAENGVDQSVNTTLFLRVRGRWAALWPFLGICCEVAILAVTIILSSKNGPAEDVT